MDHLAMMMSNALVVDKPGQLGPITTFLTREGWTVIAAASGEYALSPLPDLPVDLRILDLPLSGVDGRQLAAELKTRVPGCPVVITSVLDVQDYPRAEELLPKPVTRTRIAVSRSRHILDRTCP